MPLIVDEKSIPFSDLDHIRKIQQAKTELLDVYDFLSSWFNKKSTITAMTSGSTGTPKEIKIAKTAMVSSAEKTAAFFQFKPRDYVLNSLPIKFIAGRMMLVRSIVSDLNLIVVSPSSTPLVGYESYSFAFVPLTPYQLSQSVTKAPSSLTNVDTILLGGGPVMPQLMDKIPSLSATIYHGYGMTETLTHIALRNLSKMESSFTPLPGVSLSTGQEGQLIIEADHLEDMIVTTDLVNLDKEGGFSWIGRMDNVINTGGVKVIPELVENLLKPSLACECLIARQPDVELGERVILILESETKPSNVEEIVNKYLSKYQQPKAIYLLPQFIRTQTLKIQRKATVEAALRNI